MAKVAYKSGADYFYRVNDDTELVTVWPNLFVTILQGLSFPYGVVGPDCNEGNGMIFTHDFTHRTHMEIFDQIYYPPNFDEIYMDDWISLIYGRTRSIRAYNVMVIHHLNYHGTRHGGNLGQLGELAPTLNETRTQMRNFLVKKRIDNETMSAFDKDEYIDYFSFFDIPQDIKHDFHFFD